MKALSWINCILGLWLIVAAFALSMASHTVMTEEIVLGIVVAMLSVISTIRLTAVMSWLVAIAGLWTLLAPAVISYVGLAASRANDVIVGIIVIVLGVASALYPAPVHTSA